MIYLRFFRPKSVQKETQFDYILEYLHRYTIGMESLDRYMGNKELSDVVSMFQPGYEFEWVTRFDEEQDKFFIVFKNQNKEFEEFEEWSLFKNRGILTANNKFKGSISIVYDPEGGNLDKLYGYLFAQGNIYENPVPEVLKAREEAEALAAQAQAEAQALATQAQAQSRIYDSLVAEEATAEREEESAELEDETAGLEVSGGESVFK